MSTDKGKIGYPTLWPIWEIFFQSDFACLFAARIIAWILPAGLGGGTSQPGAKTMGPLEPPPPAGPGEEP